jgi:hypothetical protein
MSGGQIFGVHPTDTSHSSGASALDLSQKQPGVVGLHSRVARPSTDAVRVSESDGLS